MSEIRTIHTRLKHKEAAFKMLAVAEACRLPILFIGVPGTGKTNILLDYAASKYQTKEETMLHSFILEVDEGTKSSEIKGRVDVESLVIDNKYRVDSPIVAAKYVLINEVDKASSSFRNAMLSAMNERVLMTGKEQIPLQWDVWAASCNVIPEDEKGSPFWDRFAIKLHIERLNKTNLSKMMTSTPNLVVNTFEITVPTLEEIQAMPIDEKKFEKFIEHTYNSLSDRTITLVPNIIRAIQIVYSLGQSTALVKACEILAGIEIAKKLSNDIEPKELIAIREKIDKTQQIIAGSVLKSTVKEIENDIVEALRKKVIDELTKDALVNELKQKIATNKYIKVNVKETQGAEVTMDASI